MRLSARGETFTSIGTSVSETNNPLIIGIQKLLAENRRASGNAYIRTVNVCWTRRNRSSTKALNFDDCDLYMRINLSRQTSW